ncbi:TetR/AcrR family transcriptional regulator [Sphingomonas sp. PL-96]|uniref:TetR/AcrR family transcriptional regulator n=1 Tax=Sphingomonas sp. PL-96 TaxID=2887201 RepID=UPI001E415AB3|nr:TetR/AcrR family transcriptional regulator [Sphingomonas sp. PL-96]MCC2978265.1 TetR/AcrR family transcriptional regulator [Sphingomonas sp. PL-96]
MVVSKASDVDVPSRKSSSPKQMLAPRDPRGGRPSREIAARLGGHILEVALDQLVVHGPDKTSMDAIALAAKVSKRTLYARYGSKVGLLIAALEHAIDDRHEPIVAAARRGTPRQRLMRAARKMLDVSLTPEILAVEKLALWARDQLIESGDAEAKINIQHGPMLIQKVLEEALEADEVKSLDLPFLATMIFDNLVMVPRMRILIRLDLPNSARAKKAYLEQTLDVFARAFPLLRA